MLRALYIVAISALTLAGTSWVLAASAPGPAATPGPAAGARLAPAPDVPPGEIRIRPGSEPPAVDTGRRGRDGRAILANCTTCHATREPARATNRAEQLDEFHQGLQYAHGERSCLSCHNPDDYDSLHLADGRKVAWENSMALCTQCHGPQARDYRRGSHGGMRGYWDLAAGGRERNHCIDCHDPHMPAIGQVMPVLPPNDRFLRRDGEAHHD